MSKFKIHKTAQIGMVVRDAKKKLENFKELFEIDESSIQVMGTEYLQFRPKYHGEDVNFDLTIYLFDMGGIQFELIQPHADSGDPYSDFLKEHGEGIHHIFVAMDDPDRFLKVMEEKGIKEHTSGKMYLGEVIGETNYFYYDLRDELGLLMEMSNYKGPESQE